MESLQAFDLFAQLDARVQLEMSSMSFEMLCDLVRSVTDLSVTIKKHRNSLVPVNRLPQEILDEIFELVVDPPSVFTFTSSLDAWKTFLNVVESMKTLSGVCVRWSHIVRHNPALYYHIVDDYGYNCAESLYPRFFLKRSGARPLRLLAGFPPKPGSIAADLLQHHMLRLRELHIHSKYVSDMDALPENCLSRPAPTLQCFTADFEYGIESEAPLELFDGEAPCLEALALRMHGCGMLPLQTFPKLAHIFFSGINCDLTKLLDFLRDSPNLETIYLEDILFEADALDDPQPNAPVGSHAMPLLRAFVCSNTSVLAIMHILAGIIMPPGVRVVNLSTVFDLREDLIVHLPPQFSLKATLQALGPFDELDIVDEDDVISVKAVGHSCRFWLRCEGSDDEAVQWLDPVLAALPSTHVVTMRVVMSIHTAGLPDLFRRTPSLRKLVLQIPDYDPEFDQSVLGQCSSLEYADENSMPELAEIDLQIEIWAGSYIDEILSLFVAVARSRKDAMTASALRVFRVNLFTQAPELDALRELVTELKVTDVDLWNPTIDEDKGSKLWTVSNKWWTMYSRDEYEISEDPQPLICSAF